MSDRTTRALSNQNQSPLTHPLAYCPPTYLGAKTEKVNISTALRGILLDSKIWQLSTETTQNGALVTLVYKGMVEHLYKQYQTVSPDGIPRPDLPSKIYQVFLSLSSRSEGIGMAPKYVLNLWVVDQEGEGCTVEDYEVGLEEVLREIFPTAQTFKLRWERFLEGDFLVRVVG